MPPIAPRDTSVAQRTAWAAATVVPGVFALGLLNSLVHYPAHLQGFWDYPSGTIGDGLLLPFLIVVVGIQTRALAVPAGGRDRRLGSAACIVGLLVGAAVPASWVLNGSTGHMWLLPTDHHFTAAGWLHTVYASVTSGVIATLVVRLVVRIRGARVQNAPDQPAIGLVTAGVGAGMGMLVLIGRDAVVGGLTAASVSTLAPLCLTAVALLSGLTWAYGGVRISVLRPALLIAMFLSGLVVAIVSWSPDAPLVTSVTAASFVLVVAAMTSEAAIGNDAPLRLPAALTSAVVLAGTFVRAVDAYARHESYPVAWIAGGLVFAAVAAGLAASTRAGWTTIVRYVGLAGYCSLVGYLSARLYIGPAGSSTASASVGVADTAFDILVFALIQSRFENLGSADRENLRAEYVEEVDAYQPYSPTVQTVSTTVNQVVSDVFLLGCAVAAALLTLLVVAAGPSGLNQNTVAPAPARWAGLVGVGAALLLFLANEFAMARWRIRTPDQILGPQLERLQLPRWYAVGPILLAAVWIGTAVTLVREPFHLTGLSVGVGLAVFGVAFQSLLFSPTLLHTLRPTLGQIGLAFVVAVSMAVATGWLVGNGIWNGQASLGGQWIALTALGLFVGNLVVFAGAGRTLAMGLPPARAQQPNEPEQTVLARQAVRGYFALDGTVIGLVVTIGVVIPLYAATRDDALHGVPLTVIASMVFLPGLVTAVFWGLHNWTVLDDLTREVASTAQAPRTLVHRYGNFSVAKDHDRQRVRRLHFHLTAMKIWMRCLLGLGLLYLASVLLQL